MWRLNCDHIKWLILSIDHIKRLSITFILSRSVWIFFVTLKMSKVVMLMCEPLKILFHVMLGSNWMLAKSFWIFWVMLRFVDTLLKMLNGLVSSFGHVRFGKIFILSRSVWTFLKMSRFVTFRLVRLKIWNGLTNVRLAIDPILSRSFWTFFDISSKLLLVDCVEMLKMSSDRSRSFVQVGTSGTRVTLGKICIVSRPFCIRFVMFWEYSSSVFMLGKPWKRICDNNITHNLTLLGFNVEYLKTIL